MMTQPKIWNISHIGAYSYFFGSNQNISTLIWAFLDATGQHDGESFANLEAVRNIVSKLEHINIAKFEFLNQTCSNPAKFFTYFFNVSIFSLVRI